MPLAIGLDVGTTTITALAVDAASGEIVARSTRPNDAEITAPDGKVRGYSEWDASRIAAAAWAALGEMAATLGPRARQAAAIGLTGQQHGVVLVDEQLSPLGPFINWQDRRAEGINPASGRTWLDEVRQAAGPTARQRTGCTLSAGYMGTTLAWLRANGRLPPGATACFLVDYLAALLTGQRPVTDPTSAASSGLFDVAKGEWDRSTIEALNLPAEVFPKVARGGAPLGPLSAARAAESGLPAGLPVCVGLGDNQAAFYGSVADLASSVLVNVGTGGQVAAFSPRFVYSERLETRPFPGGYLLVSAGLCGGRTYAILERFFRQTCAMAPGAGASGSLFEAMNRLAASVPPGAGGLRCEPLFTGTRSQPDLRATFSGASAENFTPAHVTRALIEGMARIFRQGYDEIASALGAPRDKLIGAGNGLRENAVLAAAIASEFRMPLALCERREEAAFGAALSAAVGTGAIECRQAALGWFRYSSS
ncbi:MAG TPA: FGGY family carbohydrate kinase [Pirellulales bacterium]|nr:FGGY family carbohydrate kinase [Pirellulales bacterium]